MKKKILLTVVIGAMALNIGCGNTNESEETIPQVESTSEEVINNSSSNDENISEELLQFSEIQEGEEVAIIKTNYGDIKVRFFPEQAPKAVENFLTHAKNGYYDGVIFHRVIEDFMIQGGDPEGTGMGGESIWGEDFENEIDLRLRHFNGALSMANTGQDSSNGSQFFIVQNQQLNEGIAEDLQYYIENQDEVIDGITVKDVYPTNISEKYIEVGGTPWLDAMHTVFGQVYEGMDIVNKIAISEVDENDRPVEDVIIESIEVLEYTK